MSRLIGAGNGQPNELSDVGKAVLERIQSGKYTRTAKPYSRLVFRDEHARCLREGILFEDPEFPANDTSIYFQTKPVYPLVWKRPGELSSAPKLIAGGHSRFDVNQGSSSDCWFMAAAADLTRHDELFYRVVPPDQDFTPEKYAGIFHFQFWQYGEWVDVVVDDRLPCYNDIVKKVDRLYFVRSNDTNEFWSALLEKAYAKMHGSYEHLNMGWTNDALVDLTGGVPEHHSFPSKKDEIINYLSRDLKNSIFGSYIINDVGQELELKNGLITGHAYSITFLEKLDTKDGQLVLVRLRNPWGNDKEWKGRFGDESPEWNNVPEDKRKSLLKRGYDGEFWMHIDDFIEQFHGVDECHLPLHELKEMELMTGIPQPHAKLPEFKIAEHGSWSYKDRRTKKPCYPLKNEKICPDIKGCLISCPQYLLTVESGPGSAGQQKESVVITLLQKYRRQLKTKGVRNLHLGIAIYKAPKNTNSRVDQTFMQQNRVNAANSERSYREMMLEVALDPGDYIIVPFKQECFFDGDYVMRMFSNARLQSKLLK